MFDVAVFAVACGLVAAVSWGLGDFFAAKASRLGGAASSAMVVNGIGGIAFAVFYLAAYGPHVAMPHQAFAYATAASLAMALGQLALFRGLAIGPVSLVSPISSTYPLVTTMGLLLFFHAHLSGRQLAGVGCVVLSTLAVSGLFGFSPGRKRIGKGLAYALAVSGLWGLGYVLMSQALLQTTWQAASLVQMTIIALTCVVLSPLVQGTERVFAPKTLRLLCAPVVIGAGLALMIGMVVVNAGIHQSPQLVPIVTAVSACYPVLTMVLALRHFGEERRLLPLAGALASIGGVVLLSLG